MSASKVENLCPPSHPYKSFGKVTCRRVTSIKAFDTACLHCRAERDLSLSTSRGEAALYESRPGRSPLGTGRGAQERGRRVPQEGTEFHLPLRLIPSVGWQPEQLIVFKLLPSSPLSLPKYAQLSLCKLITHVVCVCLS